MLKKSRIFFRVDESYTSNRFGIARFQTDGGFDLAEPPYVVNGATVYITQDGRYLISEPNLSADAEKIWRHLMDNLYYSYSGSHDDVVRSIKERLEDEAKQTSVLDIYSKEKESIEYYLIRDIAGYRELDVLMNDPAIEDIICTRFDREAAIIHKRYLKKEMLKTNVVFSTQESFDGLLQIMAQRLGHAPTTSKPIVYCSTPNNDRITITWRDEISRPGSTLAIRKFPKEPYTITHLLESGVLSPLMAAYVWIMNDARSFSFVVGETGSGKTTAINALVCMSNPRWHILTIEEVRELTIPHFWNEHMVTRSSPQLARSEYDIDIMGLGMAALRKKPHYVIVGEIRGREVQQLFQIALTGHGCVSSIHAPSASDLMTRLGGDEMGVSKTQQGSINYLLNIQKVKTGDGQIRRKATSLTEVIPSKTDPVLHELFRYDPDTESFSPDTAEELVKYSRRLEYATRFLGINDIIQDIQRRIELLQKCINKKAYRIDETFKIISRYYDVKDPGSKSFN